MRNMIISNKEQVAKEVSQIMHGFSKGTDEGFSEEHLRTFSTFTMNLIKKHSLTRRCWEKVLLAKLFG